MGRGDLSRPLIALCAVGFALVYARIYFGVDFGDDSFAVGSAYEFTLGARPFVDEILVQQTGSLEVAPLVWLYATVVGSADGIVLFVRHLYIGLVLLTGWAAYVGLRDIVGRNRALITAVAATAILPAAKPVVSYKTLGALLLTVALFAGAAERRARHPASPSRAVRTGQRRSACGSPVLSVAVAVITSGSVSDAHDGRNEKRPRHLAGPLLGAVITTANEGLPRTSLATAYLATPSKRR